MAKRAIMVWTGIIFNGFRITIKLPIVISAMTNDKDPTPNAVAEIHKT